jgi:hypothetical protein
MQDRKYRRQSLKANSPVLLEVMESRQIEVGGMRWKAR